MNRKFQKYLFLLAAFSMILPATTSCIPTRNAINGMISSSILNGIGLAITFAVESAFSGLDPTPTPAAATN